MSAKSNIEKLPEWCYGVLNTNNSIIRVKSGEPGFYRIADTIVIENAKKELETEDSDLICDHLNTEMNITKAQREAMEWGSMFGWESEMANVDNYSVDGTYIK